MDRDSVIKKVQALLNLAGDAGATQAEAANAAARAQELLTKYQLHRCELEDAGAPQVEVVEVVARSHDGNSSATGWRGILLRGITEANSCVGLKVGFGEINDSGNIVRGHKLHIIGKKDMAEMCGYLYAALTREIRRLSATATRQRYATGQSGRNAYANSFRIGAAVTISYRLTAAKREEVARAARERGEGVTALVRRDDQLAHDFINMNYAKVVKGGKISSSSQAGERDGAEAGRHIDIPGGASRTQLGPRVRQIGGVR